MKMILMTVTVRRSGKRIPSQQREPLTPALKLKVPHKHFYLGWVFLTSTEQPEQRPFSCRLQGASWTAAGSRMLGRGMVRQCGQRCGSICADATSATPLIF